MLILLSDLHLTDETTANNIDPSSLELLCDHATRSAKKAGVEKVELVLLGDCFDLVRTSHWVSVSRDERPWNSADKLTADGANPNRVVIEKHLRKIVERIVEAAATQKLFAMLQRVRDESNRPVEVRYVLGNHDRMLLDHPDVATLLWKQFPEGLRPTLSLELRDREHSLLARHGHQWDEHNHGFAFAKDVGNRSLGRFDEGAHRVMTIGEVVTAELMSGLIHRLQSEFHESKHAGFIAAMKDLNNLRPFTAVFEWITWLAEDAGHASKYVGALGKALKGSLEAVVSCDLATQWDRLRTSLLVSGDLVDRLQQALFVLGKDANLRRLRTVLPQAHAIGRFVARFGDHLDTLAQGAAEDFEDEDPEIQFLAYGHSHHPRRDWFQGQRDRVRLYVNTGTFLPLVERAHKGNGFCQSERMTFSMVFRAGEAGGKTPSIDVWDGMRKAR
jgi:UDP-2,3-diacylglucosamine pyrophosphatase LpxH